MIRQASLSGVALALLVAVAPMPFGAVTPKGSLALALACFALATWALGAAPSLAALRNVAPAIAALVGLALLGFLQSCPAPTVVVRAISPAHATVAAESAALCGEVLRTVPLSLEPEASRQTALWLLALAALLATAALAGDDRQTRRWLAWGLFAGAAFQVFFGAQHWFARAREIWGVEVPGDAGRLRGTYVNSDHLALYLEIALTAVFAWCYRAARRLEPQLTAEQRLARLAPPLFFWGLLFTALAFTGSRAGVAAAVGATVAQGLVVARGKGDRRIWLLAVWGLLGLGVAMATAIGFEQAFGRLLGTSAYELGWNIRGEAYRTALGLLARYPVFGSGLGSFRETFAAVQPTEGGLIWRHLHNDWLELALTTGIAGVALLVCGLVPLVRRLSFVLRHGHRGEDRGAALAALGALAAAGFHSLLDFGLTMPANAAALAIVVGAGAAARAGAASAPVEGGK